METSLGLGHRVPAGGDGGVDVAAVVAVCEALRRAWHRGNPQYLFLPSLSSSPSTSWSPLAVARTLLVSKLKGCPAEPRGVGRAPRPPSQVPRLLEQGQPAALLCPNQGPRHTGSLGKTLDSKQATAPAFARHRFPSSFLPTFSLAEREVFQALAYMKNES